MVQTPETRTLDNGVQLTITSDNDYKIGNGQYATQTKKTIQYTDPQTKAVIIFEVVGVLPPSSITIAEPDGTTIMMNRDSSDLGKSEYDVAISDKRGNELLGKKSWWFTPVDSKDEVYLAECMDGSATLNKREAKLEFAKEIQRFFADNPRLLKAAEKEKLPLISDVNVEGFVATPVANIPAFASISTKCNFRK